MTADKLAEEILAGSPRAVARGISLAENDIVQAQKLMKAIFSHTGKGLILGVTGAPGSGKSTLVDQLISRLKADDPRIGIIAVDPSSPFTGGAILGDRIRMMRHSEDPDIFIRSMATRGHMGGLARATGEAIAVLEAAGKRIIVIETVGVGQDEVEVVKIADLILVVLVPGAGDDIQVFKAGIMEIADIFVLNKADSMETARTERQLRAMLELGLKDKALPPVCKTVATESSGIDELADAIRRVLAERKDKDRSARKKRLVEWMIRDIISEKALHEIGRRVTEREFRALVDRVHHRQIDPYSAAESLLERLKGL